MALIKPTDNDLITLIVKKILNEGGYTFTLYRDVVKGGASSINGRKIKFFGVHPIRLWATPKVKRKKVRKRIIKTLSFVFGDKYIVNDSSNGSHGNTNIQIHNNLEK